MPDDAAVTDIIASAEVQDPPNVFCLGPYGRRVNFAAQQTRALNLIWALKTKGRIKKGHHIAVVGGGLSGLMAAASLLDMGCRVDLYEGKSELLWRQRHTTHRIVHPNLNRWPDSAVQFTTEFPFCDWYQDYCKGVLDTVIAAWDTFVSGSELKPHLNRPIEKPMRVGDKVGLKASPPIQEGPFDAVVVATGFDDEEGIRGIDSGSYWSGDDLERLRGQDVNRKFLISGCGDGGLIDTLRLAYSKFQLGDLAIEVAAQLGPDDDVATIIRNGEKKAAAIVKSKYEDAIDDAASLLKGIYDQAVEKLPDEIKKKLVLVDQLEIVTLVCKEIEPFSRMSAPIHKLMLHYAHTRSRVNYRSGTLEQSGSYPQIRLRTDPTNPVPVHEQTIVVRHGAKLAIAIEKPPFLDPAVLEDLRKHQHILSDRLDRPYWKTSALGEGPHPAYDTKNKDFIEARMPLAERALSKITRNFHVGYLNSALDVCYRDNIPDPNLPSSIFGIKLVPSVPPEVPLA